jgi:hypothetical protein
LGALFNGPGLNPNGYETLKQEFAALMRAVPAADAPLASESLLTAVNAIARRLIDEQATAPADTDEDDFAAGKMAGTVQFAAEMIKHIQLASASITNYNERN